MILLLTLLIPVALLGAIPALSWFEDRMLDPASLGARSGDTDAERALVLPSAATGIRVLDEAVIIPARPLGIRPAPAPAPAPVAAPVPAAA
jgi:hypothetical protein